MNSPAELAIARAREEPGLRVLLIEDDPNDAELVQACLAEAARAGAEIVHATTLAEGLSALRSQVFHVTVLDLDLPDSTGFDTLEKLGSAARSPIIVVTGNPEAALATEELKRRAYEVLAKSELEPRSLMRIVRRATLQGIAQRELGAAERRYPLIDDSRQPIGLFGASAELLYGNAAMRRMLWNEANLVELAHPTDREALRSQYAELASRREHRLTLKAHFRHRDGSWRMLEASLENRLEDGEVAAVVASFTDISSQVDLEQRFRTTFDEAAVGIAHIAEDGRFELVNRKLCQILGYTREELGALSVFDVSHPEDRDVTQALRRKMRAHEIDSFSVIKRYLRKDGTFVWAEVTSSLVRAAGGAPRYSIALFEDISARRQAEEALQRSERRFRALIENSADGILLTDAEARITYGSPGVRRTLGYGKGETLGWRIADLVHPHDRPGFDRMVASAAARPGVTHELRARVRHRSGRYRLLEGTCADLCADESVRAVVYNFRDVTEREEALARTRESEARFRSLANLSSDWYWEQDEELRFTWASPGAEARGAPLSDIMGRRRWEVSQYAPLSQTWEEHRATLEAHKPFRDFEYVRTAPDGERRYIAINGEPVFREDGRFQGYRGTARDITERKLAELGMARLKTMYAALGSANEAILRASSAQELLSRVCEIAVAAGNFVLVTAFLFDRDSGQLRRVAASGPASAFPLGETAAPDSMIAAAWQTREVTIANDYQNDPRSAARRQRARAFPHPVAAGAVWPLFVDGEAVGVFSMLHAEKDAFSDEMNQLLRRLAGNLSFALANMAHEERRLQAEQELRRFRAALNASAESIFLIDADALQIIDVNDAAARLLGYERDAMIGANPAILFEGRDEAHVRAEYERLTINPEAAQFFRAHLRRRDGTLVPVEGSRRLLRASGRNYVVGIARDISERIKAEERLQQSLERFEIVARATNDVVWDWNLVTDQLWWNENFSTVFGYDSAEVGAYIDAWTARIHPEDAARVKEDIRSAIERGERVWTAEYRFRRKDGSYANVFDRGLPLRDRTGRPVRMIGAMVDITERKRAERKMALHAQRQEIIARLGQFALGGADLEQVLGEAARVLRAGGCDVAAIIERVGEHGYEFVVRAARGEGAEDCVGKSKVLPAHSKWATLLDSAAGAVEHDRKYFESRDSDRPWSFWLRRLGSGVYVPIRSETGPFGILMMGSLRDAAFDGEDLSFAEAIAHVLSTAVRRHHTQTRLAYMAEFDSLTGLPNRNLLQDRLGQSLAQARRRQWQGAVLFIDLDRFKLINDTLGHHIGDRLIAEVGRRIRQCVRGGDTVGRVSGDEFGVVLTDLAQADDAAIVAQKILDALARPFDLGGNETYVTASIGISVFPADGDDAETLLKNADMAMYRAKELTRNAYCFFTAEMNQRSVAKLQLNTDLRHAIERGEFALHYQPKLDLRDGSLHGVEALLRWNHPQRGTVMPEEFIPALEDSGLILPVGEWVLSEAARQLGAWRREGLEPVPVAVNLSAKQFRRRDLDSLIRGVLAATEVPAGLIELEITESCLMEEPEEALRLLASLRGAGLRISVDDFGTGYSSLSYLTRLPITALKIDRGFVRNAARSREAASIVRAVIDMAHNLGFTVIAEGVETEEQVAFLRHHGCDQGQGFLFAEPMPAGELAGRLRRLAPPPS